MIFNKHSYLDGNSHAFLSASKYHWINYDPDKLETTFLNWQMAQRGTDLHALAHELIRLKVKMGRSRTSLNMYVNDAIGFDMATEQPLFYSFNCFGRADAISFKKNFLRIHDFKSGVNPTSFHQLEIYMALFCLEYNFMPHQIEAELRIYQNDEVLAHVPDHEFIRSIMTTIIAFDKRIDQLKIEG